MTPRGRVPRLPLWLVARTLPPDLADDVTDEIEARWRSQSGPRLAATVRAYQLALSVAWHATREPAFPPSHHTNGGGKYMWPTVNDLRLAGRRWIGRPTLALTAILILALGIGVTTSIYSIVDTALRARRSRFHAFFKEMTGSGRRSPSPRLGLPRYEWSCESTRVFDAMRWLRGERLVRATVLGLAAWAAAALSVGASQAGNQPNVVRARMELWSASLGVTCDHCHVQDRWTDRAKPAFDFAERMSRMVASLNTGVLKDMAGVTCWTCHRGQTQPARLPVERWTVIRDKHAADFASKPDSALAMSVYAASLGVACTHCHIEGNWGSDARPAHATAQLMARIFEEIPKHFDPSRRPRTQCFMCHQGSITPQRVRPVTVMHAKE